MSKRCLFLIGCFFLVGCAPKPLPSSEVLQRATLASQQLTSAKFSVSINGTYSAHKTGQQMTGIVTSDGVMNDHGLALSQHFSADLSWGGVTKPAHATIGADMTAINGQTFFRIGSAALEPNSAENMFSFLTPMLGAWYVLPTATGAVLGVTPDPNVLKSQSEIVTVERDNGIQKDADGYAYHYLVSLDQEKFLRWLKAKGQLTDEQIAAVKDLKANGALTIDAKSFYLKSAIWQINSVPISDGVVSASITIQLTDHDKEVHIEMPKDARQFPMEEFTFPGGQEKQSPSHESGTIL